MGLDMCFFRKKINLQFEDDEIIGVFIPERNIKVGHVFSVPDGRTAFLYYYDKLYNTLEAGEYKLDYTSVPKVLQRQERKPFGKNKQPKKLKNFTADIYLVKNNFEGSIEHKFVFRWFKYENKKRSPLAVTAQLKFKLTDSKKFLQGALSEEAYLKKYQANKKLNNWTYYDIKDYIILNPLASPKEIEFSKDYIFKLAKYLNNEYREIGIEFTFVNLIKQQYTDAVPVRNRKTKKGKSQDKPSIFSNSKQEKIIQKDKGEEMQTIDITQIFEIKNAEMLPSIEELQQKDKSLSIDKIETDKLPQIPDTLYCPKCQTAIFNNAKFCHKCGWKFK